VHSRPDGLSGWGVSIAWLSILYQPGGEDEFVVDELDELDEFGGYEPHEDDGIQIASLEPPSRPDPFDLGIWDHHYHPAWNAWLYAHMSRPDIFLMFTVDDRPAPRAQYSYSKKESEHRVNMTVPVQDFLVPVVDVRRLAYRWVPQLYARIATKLELPPPPPPLTAIPPASPWAP
jgi:hypothetical protein